MCSVSGKGKEEGQSDTPKFKQRSEKEQNKSERLRNKV
jgi:hypothetical protein